MVRKKIMIINWKWTWFHGNHITDQYLSKNENEYLLKNIKKGKNKFFEIYPVENSGKTQDAIVVATSIYQGEKTKEILYQLIQYIYELYKCESCEIYLFLHRGNFYNGEDVLDILNEITCVKNCFLFAHGRDYLYFDLKKEGFLDQAGGFRRGRVNGRKVIVAKKMTESIDKKGTRFKIQQPYFDNVWDYYEFEFYTKIAQMKRDLFAWLIRYNKKDYPLQKEMFIENLKNADKLLYIRLKSFLGVYDNLPKIASEESKVDILYQLKQEREQLEKFEKKSNNSYILDDCNANLIHFNKNDKEDKQAHDYYVELKKLLSRIILNKQDGIECLIEHKDILTIRKIYNALIEVLPGH